jgi:hypothetical protein
MDLNAYPKPEDPQQNSLLPFFLFLAALLVALALSGCVRPPVPIVRQHVLRDSTVIRVRDSLVVRPAATVTAQVSLQRPPSRQVVVRTDTTGRAQLRYWLDRYGTLQLECTALRDSLTARHTETHRYIRERILLEAARQEKKLGERIEAFLERMLFFGLAFLALIGLLLMIYIRYKRFQATES